MAPSNKYLLEYQMKKFLIALALISTSAMAEDSNKCVAFKTAQPSTPLQQAVYFERIRQDIRNMNPRLNTSELTHKDLEYIGSKMYCDPKFDKRFLKQMIGQVK